MKLEEKNKPFHFLRLSLSEYQDRDFASREAKKVEPLGLQYALRDLKSFKGSCILVTNSQTPILDCADELIERTSLLIHPNSGYDNLLKDKRIVEAPFPVILGNPIRAHAVSEYILSQIFEVISSIGHQPFWQPKRQWSRDLLREKTVCLIGFGHIGAILYRTLHSLVKEIIIFDPFKDHSLDLDEALSKSDIILPVCSLNPSSINLLNKKRIHLLKEGFILINASRGKILDQGALVERLKKDQSSYACLDVFEKEPFIDRLSSFNNLKTTSHIAGVFKNLDKEIIDFTSSITKDFLHLKITKFQQKYASLLLSNRHHNGVII